MVFHTFQCEGGPRILRSFHIQTSVFLRAPRTRQSLVLCLAVEEYRKLWIYWEMTSGIFRFSGMLRSTVDFSFMRQSAIRHSWLDSGYTYWRQSSVPFLLLFARGNWTLFLGPSYLALACSVCVA